MARIRSIKPEFFDDPEVAEVSAFARLCFIGLWIQSDRAGRLVYDARRLKARIFPYDNLDIDLLCVELENIGFIHRYTVEGKHFLQVRSFVKHQRPHPKEPESVIPIAVERNGEPCKNTERKVVSGSLDNGSLDNGISTIHVISNSVSGSNGNGHKPKTQKEKDHDARLRMLASATGLRGRNGVSRQKRAR